MRKCMGMGIAIALLSFTSVAGAQYLPFSLLIDGDILVPSGNEADNVNRPSLSSAGHVATDGDDIATTLDDFIWVDGLEVVRSGTLLLGGAPGVTLDNVDTFDSGRHVNASGSVAYDGDIDGSPGSTNDDEALMLDDTIIMIEDVIYPGVDPARDPGEWSQISVDDFGTVYAEVDLDGGATTDDEVLIMIPLGGSPSAVPMNIASEFREGSLIVGGDLDGESWETSVPFSNTVCNGVGDLIIDGNLDDSVTTTLDNDDVLIRKLATADYELLLRAGDSVTLPLGGSALITSFEDQKIADNGDWAVEVDTDADTGSDNLVMADVLGSGPIVIAQEDMDLSAITGIPGTTLGFIDSVGLTSTGQVLFGAPVDDDGVNIPPYDEALFIWDAGVITMILTDEAPIVNLPGVNLTDIEGDDVAINGAGKIVFQGDGATTTDDGIFEAFLPSVFPVDMLACAPAPGIPNQIVATWTNPQAYDGINIYENGAFVTTLAGTDTSYTSALYTSPTVVEIGVEPFAGVETAPEVACSATAVVPPDFSECQLSSAAIDSTLPPVEEIFSVATNVLIDDLTIFTDITHTFQADIEMSITSPLGTTVELSTDNGGSNDDILTTWADFGQPISSNLNDFDYTQPEGPGAMADFRCEMSGGDWLLFINDDAGGDVGTLNEWCVNLYESVGDADCCPKPTQFTCANIGACGGPGAELTWANNGTYDLLQLVRDDGVNPVVILPLATTDTSFTDFGAAPGSYSYTLQYTCTGGVAVQDAATCDVTVDATTVPTVTDLVCTPDFCGNTVTLDWSTNGVNYDSITILQGGSPIATLAGTDTTFIDVAPVSGTYSVVSTCGGSDAAESCVVDLVFGGATNFACASDGLGGVSLTWTNNDSYDVLEVRRNGMLLPTQPATTDEVVVDAMPTEGCNTYELTAGCGAFTETYTCVIAFFDPNQPISDTVLMIPDTTEDSIGLYSKECGAFIGNLFDPVTTLPVGVTFGTLINALYNPADDRIYMSDQTNDRVYRFERDGTFVDIFVDSSSASLDNLRGMDFRGTDLLIAQDGAAPAEGIQVIDSLGVDQGVLVSDQGFWDVKVLPDNRFLICESTSDTVRLYEADGLSFTDLLIPGLSFPEQLSQMQNGNFALIDFTNDEIVEFDLTGTVLNTYDVDVSGNTPRGLYLLDNGNYLFTGSAGIFSLDPVSGTIAELRGGVQARFVEELPPGGVAPITFVRGDINIDGSVNIADAVYVLGNLFPGANPPNPLDCLDSADANDDGSINIADAISLLASLFGTPTTPLPSPNSTDGCGPDPTDGDPLDCASFNPCP